MRVNEWWRYIYIYIYSLLIEESILFITFLFYLKDEVFALLRRLKRMMSLMKQRYGFDSIVSKCYIIFHL